MILAEGKEVSGWEEFKSGAGKIASKAACRVGELADAAAARIKLQGVKLRLCEEYEKLGRLTYRSCKQGTPTDAAEAVIAEIDRLRARIKKLECEIKAEKKAREAEGKAGDKEAAPE
jgi:hypothetical protein